MASKAIFLDRDGVLIKDQGNLTDKNAMNLYSDVGDALAKFRELGYLLIMVTNQAVVARGGVSESELDDIHKHLQSELLNQNSEAKLDDVYYCPHHLNATLEAYRKDCRCRKPYTGMIEAAQSKYDIDLENSIMIGDRHSDMKLGNLAGCKTVLIESGKHLSPPTSSSLKYDIDSLEINYRVSSLWEFAKLCVQ